MSGHDQPKRPVTVLRNPQLTQQDDQYVLRSENPKYPPRYIMEGDELVAWGVVKANVHFQPCHA